MVLTSSYLLTLQNSIIPMLKKHKAKAHALRSKKIRELSRNRKAKLLQWQNKWVTDTNDISLFVHINHSLCVLPELDQVLPRNIQTQTHINISGL